MTHSVLVVDDEPNIVLSLEFLMKNEGHEVRVAKDGAEAISAFQEKVPDLVLLDIMVPKLDGYAVCESIRANPDWQHVPIIILTAKGRETEKEKGLSAGADDFVTKPFSTRDVVERVEKLLSAGRETA